MRELSQAKLGRKLSLKNLAETPVFCGVVERSAVRAAGNMQLVENIAIALVNAATHAPVPKMWTSDYGQSCVFLAALPPLLAVSLRCLP